MIFLGKILKVRGNKGEVVLNCAPDFKNQLIEKNTTLILKSKKYHREQKIEYIKKIDDNIIVKFAGINVIREAFQLVGYSVFHSGGNLQEKKNVDLIHFTVKDLQDIFWGKVKNIQKNDLNMVLEIENRGEIIYIPLCDDIVSKILENEKLIIIDPPEGLRNLNK